MSNRMCDKRGHELCECNRFNGSIDTRPHCKWCGVILEVTTPKPIDTAKHEVSKPAAGHDGHKPDCAYLRGGYCFCPPPSPQAEPSESAGERTHDLKTWPQYFSAVLDGTKTFELRKDDRGYQVGDLLNLREWVPLTGGYTGRSVIRRVSYIAKGVFGLPEDTAILAFASQPSTLPQSPQTLVWKNVCASEVFQELKHGKFRDILDLLADGQISVGKASQAIVERANGVEPRLPFQAPHGVLTPDQNQAPLCACTRKGACIGVSSKFKCRSDNNLPYALPQSSPLREVSNEIDGVLSRHRKVVEELAESRHAAQSSPQAGSGDDAAHHFEQGWRKGFEEGQKQSQPVAEIPQLVSDGDLAEMAKAKESFNYGVRTVYVSRENRIACELQQYRQRFGKKEQ